jgi:hypothetical protein
MGVFFLTSFLSGQEAGYDIKKEGYCVKEALNANGFGYVILKLKFTGYAAGSG